MGSVSTGFAEYLTAMGNQRLTATKDIDGVFPKLTMDYSAGMLAAFPNAAALCDFIDTVCHQADIKLEPVAKRGSGRLMVSRYPALAAGIQQNYCSRKHVMRRSHTMINLSRKTVALSAAGCFFVYVVFTLVQMFPEWQGFTATESFALAKHLVMVALIIALLILKPQLGSWIAVVWGGIVPFERYSLLVSELLNGSLFDFGALAPLDTLRLLLFFAGTCISALLAYQFHPPKSEAAANANA